MTIAAQSVSDFLGDLAAKTPAPGGGATACVAGALAAAQAEMVVAFSAGKKVLAEHQGMLAATGPRLSNLRRLLLVLAEEDAAAYAALVEIQQGAFVSSADGAETREERLRAAAARCIQIPLFALAACVEAQEIAARLKGKSNAHLASDLEIAAALAATAGRACAINVRVNLPLITDASARGGYERDLARELEQAARHGGAFAVS
ncbi:hypothetical protein BH11PLA1_BH11PLA1_13690 [soil metagenome]